MANTRIFEAIAPDYIRADSNWGSDLDVIKKPLEQILQDKKRVSLVDLGCGNAWHLANVLTVYGDSIKRVVGIDFSERMLEQAKATLNHFSYWHRIKLIRADIRELPMVRSHQDEPSQEESYDVALLLNNTLGNIIGTSIQQSYAEREKALREAHRILGKNGQLVFSVNNSRKLNPKHYGKNLAIDQENTNFAAGDLIVKYTIGDQEVSYYSHWFSEDEITSMLQSVGFEVQFIEPRMKRLVGAARKIISN